VHIEDSFASGSSVTTGRENAEAETLAARLRTALAVVTATRRIAAPATHRRLLELIVDTAARTLSAEAGSLFLVDETGENLVFEVALGEKASEVERFRVPIGQGIAGLVAATGQPLAIADAQEDPRHAAEIARDIGYTPRTILCVPLVNNDQVIGVLELLDKSEGQHFTAGDMDVLFLFARQAAIALAQSRLQNSLPALIADVLESIEVLPDDERGALAREASAFAAAVEGDERLLRAGELGRMVAEIAGYGEDEANACRSILRAFLSYLASRPVPFEGARDQ
jgi:GAF domain-containing protein